MVGALVGADVGGVSVGRLDGVSDRVLLGAALGLEDSVFDGPAVGDREGDWDSTGEGFELGVRLNVGSAEAVNDGAPLGLVEGGKDSLTLGLVEGSVVGPDMPMRKDIVMRLIIYHIKTIQNITAKTSTHRPMGWYWESNWANLTL